MRFDIFSAYDGNLGEISKRAITDISEIKVIIGSRCSG